MVNNKKDGVQPVCGIISKNILVIPAIYQAAIVNECQNAKYLFNPRLSTRTEKPNLHQVERTIMQLLLMQKFSQ
ncbi:hypothetical protein Anacy_2259 [Anabaena cylindrica PCC 7122]|uniref:Uncharacterized protein n=1 Tax=Anabaena cylindrica (strain ATCC 27899 / PCC 7122) TaxID=272123 RepID=K9ZEW9_ANACC|nr:hypothetical protein Anacy_2259 [Anabaena cylindrica PCC 7122]BAY05327.1 hypothetical protein NIES19_45980 [Anabaena cylindrica PCC 7122]